MDIVGLYVKCKNIDNYNRKFLTVGKGYLVRFVTDYTVELIGDDGEYHLTSAIAFRDR